MEGTQAMEGTVQIGALLANVGNPSNLANHALSKLAILSQLPPLVDGDLQDGWLVIELHLGHLLLRDEIELPVRATFCAIPPKH